MSREKITRMPAPPSDNGISGECGSASKPLIDRDIAAEIVAAIGADNLLDIKFLIEPSSATRDEILIAALKWIKSAEKKFAEGTLLPVSN